MSSVHPFIIWLEKTDLDELLCILEELKLQTDDVFTPDELGTFCEMLIKQNEAMKEIIKKIQPLTPILPGDIVAFRNFHACEEIRKFNSIKQHCGKFNGDIKMREEKLKEVLNCTSCSASKVGHALTPDELRKKYGKK